MERAARSGEHRRMYQLVKQLSGRCAAGTPFVKGEDGTPLKDREEVRSRWAEYFDGLLNHRPPKRRLHRIGPVGEHLELSGDPPTRLEVEKAIQKLKNTKAPGADGNVAEIIRLGPAELLSTLHQLFVKIWEDETVPGDWNKSLICTIFKKEDRSMCSNYRGILPSICSWEGVWAHHSGKNACSYLKEAL